MSRPGVTGVGSPHLWIKMAGALLAAVGGMLASYLSAGYIVGLLAFGAVLLLYFWRSADPMVPFLLLVASIQGGLLLRIPMGSVPIETLTPILGGWVIVAVLVANRGSFFPTRLRLPEGRWLSRALGALAVLIVLTALAQNWREEGRLLDPGEVFTLVQLGILVLVAAYLLSDAAKVLWLGYVTAAAGAATSLVALADRFGIVGLETGMVYMEGYTRVSGLLADPNVFSFQLLVSLAFALNLAIVSATRYSRLFFWVASAAIGAGIVSSYSAGALVGVVAVVATVVVLQFRASAKRAMAAFVVILVVGAVVAAIAPAGYVEAVGSKYASVPESSLQQLGTRRGAAWEAAAREIASNPLVGSGLSTYNTQVAIAGQYYLEQVERKAAHNTYLALGVGAGLPGLIAFLVAIGSCLHLLWSAYTRAVREERQQVVVASGCLITALVVICVQGLQLDLQMEKYVWLLMGACLAVRYWPVGQNETVR